MPVSRNAFEVINRQTGEVVDAYGLIVPTRVKHPYKENGIQVSQEPLIELATSSLLSKKAIRIALWMIASMGSAGTYFRHKDIADGLKMHKSDVSKGLKELREFGRFLVPAAQGLRVRPSVAWKGKAVDLIEAIKAEKASDWEIRRASKKSPPAEGSETPE